MNRADTISPIAGAVEEKFDQLYLCSISLIAALGGLLFGYDWVVIGGAKPFYEPYFIAAGSSGHRRLRDDVGSGNLGFAFRDFSQQSSRRCNVSRYYISLDRVLRSYLYLSITESGSWTCKDILDLRRNLRRGVRAREPMRA